MYTSQSQFMGSVSIRHAVISDLEWVILELKKFEKFYGKEISLAEDENHTLTLLSNWIENHLFLVAEKQGVAVGFITGLITPQLFNPEQTALTEVLWWVTPSHRKSSAGLKLLKQFIEHGKDIADSISMSLLAQSPVKDSTMERLGLSLKERTFLMEVS